MENTNHYSTIVKCNLCGNLRKSASLDRCPFQHQYCFDCYLNLRKKYRWFLQNEATCIVCKNITVLLHNKHGIGGPCRYDSDQIKGLRPDPKENEKKATVEDLLRIPSKQMEILLRDKNGLNNIPRELRPFEAHERLPSKLNSYNSSTQYSKAPIECPLKFCKRWFTPSNFIRHYKYEHSDIPKYTVTRGKELFLPCDVSNIEHNSNFCLAIITVCELNKIDVTNSQSSQSVIKTCEKFSRQVPIDCFWLMVTASPEKKTTISCAMIWLLCPTLERYQSTIELSSKLNSVSLATYCDVYTSCHNLKFNEIVGSLRCLLVSRDSFWTMMQEGPELSLRIIVH